jgi:hypothetical protein
MHSPGPITADCFMYSVEGLQPEIQKRLIITIRIMAPHRLGPRAEVMGQSELRNDGVLGSSPLRRSPKFAEKIAINTAIE